MRKLGLPTDFIPYDSDNRRNIGYLIALESNCAFVISIDDDNFAPSRGDYFGEHSVVCGETHEFRILSECGWFNACSLLNMEPRSKCIRAASRISPGMKSAELARVLQLRPCASTAASGCSIRISMR